MELIAKTGSPDIVKESYSFILSSIEYFKDKNEKLARRYNRLKQYFDENINI
jgi:hypothetical protein